MKGKSVTKLIGKTFGKTLCILFVLIGVGVASYFLTILFYETTSRSERCNTYEHVVDINTGSNSSNLIYAFNKDSGKIMSIVLELYESDSHNLDYITIPSATEVEIPADMYLKMMEASKEIPQIARVSNINEYFSGDVAFEYGILLLEEAMGIDIGYFTAMPSDMFYSYFTNVGTKESPQFVPSETLFAKVGGTDEDSISDFMESVWGDLISNITLVTRQKYASGLAKVNKKFIYSHRVKSEVRLNKNRKTHIIDKEAASALIEKLIDRDPYTKAQKRPGIKITSSKKKKIWITNGSKITGLAASYKDKLEDEGFKVKGIGDYTGDIQTSTTILVKEIKLGKDLLTYFPKAAIEESSVLTEDVDIEIILGTNARLTES